MLKAEGNVQHGNIQYGTIWKNISKHTEELQHIEPQRPLLSLYNYANPDSHASRPHVKAPFQTVGNCLPAEGITSALHMWRRLSRSRSGFEE